MKSLLDVQFRLPRESESELLFNYLDICKNVSNFVG